LSQRPIVNRVQCQLGERPLVERRLVEWCLVKKLNNDVWYNNVWSNNIWLKCTFGQTMFSPNGPNFVRTLIKALG
jgi:hypothetical protein